MIDHFECLQTQKQAVRTAGKQHVVVLLGKVTGRDLDPELRLALNTATLIYLNSVNSVNSVKAVFTLGFLI